MKGAEGDFTRDSPDCFGVSASGATGEKGAEGDSNVGSTGCRVESRVDIGVKSVGADVGSTVQQSVSLAWYSEQMAASLLQIASNHSAQVAFVEVPSIGSSMVALRLSSIMTPKGHISHPPPRLWSKKVKSSTVSKQSLSSSCQKLTR